MAKVGGLASSEACHSTLTVITDALDMPILIKTQGKTTTDHISSKQHPVPDSA